MRLSPRFGRAQRFAALLLLALTGCTISIQPWTKPPPPPPPHGPTPDGGPWNPALSKNGGPQNSAVANERAALMDKELREEQDLRKALQDQLASLKKQLKERDENIRQAGGEMEETIKQVRRTREEFRQWQAEMDEMRERIRKLEDYRITAKPLIEDIYRYLDKDKEPNKFKPPPSYNK